MTAEPNSGCLRVAVIDDYQSVAERVADWDRLRDSGVEVTFFHDGLDGADLIGRLREFDAIVAMRERTKFDSGVLEQLPGLRLLVSTGAHNDSIDLVTAREMGIRVAAAKSPRALQATLEHTWALILGIARRVAQEDQSIRMGAWQTGLGTLLKGQRLGIVGLGRLGTMCVPIARAFGMDVVSWTRTTRDEQSGVTMVSREDLFRTSDFISVHLRLNPDTVGYISSNDLNAMKPSAMLINTSRGAVIDEGALIEVLRKRGIRGAALDVFEHEPLPTGHPLVSMDNVLLSPHLGYATWESYEEYYYSAIEQIARFRSGEPFTEMDRRR